MGALWHVCVCARAVADLEGQQALFKILICIRMLKNKAQIAQEGVKPLELPGPWTLKWALDHCRRDFGFRARNVRSRT